MDKIAQRRGRLSKLREGVGFQGKMLEHLNAEFKEVMDKMRATDDHVRSIAEGIKLYSKDAKSFLNRRDYLNAAVKLSEFHDKYRTIAANLEYFKNGVNVKHYNFLLNNLESDKKEQLFGYDPSKKIDVSNDANDMVSVASLKRYAGLADIWYNIFDEKGRAMKHLEKRFSVDFLNILKQQTGTMVEKTIKDTGYILSAFSKLETGISHRNVELYTSIIQDFLVKFKNYHDLFVKYYDKNIIPLKTEYSKIIAAEKQKQDEIKAKQEEVKQQELQNLKDRADKVQPSVPTNPGQIVPIVPQEEPFPLVKKQLNLPFDKKETHNKFINYLEKLASPTEIAREILQYSEQLELTDKTKSLQLLAIAEGIIENYKSAGIFDDLPEELTQAEQAKHDKKVKEETTPPLV